MNTGTQNPTYNSPCTSGVREYTLKQYLERSPVVLTILDPTANGIYSLEGINLPSTLEVL